MMKTKESKKGISLIVLIIIIIVVIILAAVVILTLSKNNPIESAKEARFKEDVRTFQDELAMSVSKKYANYGGQWDESIIATTYDEILKYIPNFSKKYEGKFVINKNNLVYTNKLDEKEEIYANSLNVNPLLPKEYWQLDYIESTGTQYIDTGIFAKNYKNIIVEIEGNYTDPDKYQYVFGAGFHNDRWTSTSFILMGCVDSYFNGQIGKSKSEKMFYKSDSEKHLFVLNAISKIAKVDSTWVKLDTSGLIDINYNYSLFAINHNGTSIDNASFKMYTCKIIDKNTVIRNYVPCCCSEIVNDAQNNPCAKGTIGLYDTIEGKFYTNQGTGEFINESYM